MAALPEGGIGPPMEGLALPWAWLLPTGSQEEWVSNAKNSTTIPWRPKQRKAIPALGVVKGPDSSS